MSDQLDVENGTLTITIPIVVTVNVQRWAEWFTVATPIDTPLYDTVRRDVMSYFQTETFEQLGCGQDTGCLVLQVVGWAFARVPFLVPSGTGKKERYGKHI